MSVTERPVPLVSALPDARVSRVKTAATWLFVLPLLTEGVLPNVVKIQLAGLAVLAFVTIGSGRELPHRAAERIFAVLAVLTLTVIGYVAFGQWPQGAGTARAYDGRAVMWVITYGAVAVFAYLFFEAGLFERVLWRGSLIALSLSEALCVASRVSGHEFLVNPAHGTMRMAGTMTEPSAWAPVLAMLVILAWRRRSWPAGVLALAGLYLADSPVCLLVTAVSVALYALLSPPRLRVRLAIATLAAAAGVSLWAATANPQPYLDSGNPAVVTAGRLLAGVQSAAAGSDSPDVNSRYANTEGALEAIRDNGWMRAGAGPAADGTWVQAEYAQPSQARLAVNALWVSVLWDFGLWGLGTMVVLVLLTAWRIRRDSLLCAVLLPFMAASMVNSAVPDWTVTGLAVLLALSASRTGPSAYWK